MMKSELFRYNGVRSLSYLEQKQHKWLLVDVESPLSVEESRDEVLIVKDVCSIVKKEVCTIYVELKSCSKDMWESTLYHGVWLWRWLAVSHVAIWLFGTFKFRLKCLMHTRNGRRKNRLFLND